MTSLLGLSLEVEHRRGHGALYDALNSGRIDIARLRSSLAALPLPKTADGRIVLAVDVSNWLRPDTSTSPRLFCHVYGRGRGQAQLIPGWPYSFVAALESGRTSWTAVLDAVRLGPADDATAVTAWQVRDVVNRLITAEHWREGDPEILIVADAGYDVARLVCWPTCPCSCSVGSDPTGCCGCRSHLDWRARTAVHLSTVLSSAWMIQTAGRRRSIRPRPRPAATAPRTPAVGTSCTRG